MDFVVLGPGRILNQENIRPVGKHKFLLIFLFSRAFILTINPVTLEDKVRERLVMIFPVYPG